MPISVTYFESSQNEIAWNFLTHNDRVEEKYNPNFSKIKVVLLSRDISSYKQDSGATTNNITQLNEFQTDASGTRYTTLFS